MGMRLTTNRRRPTASQGTWVHTFHMCVPMYRRLAQHNARMLILLEKTAYQEAGEALRHSHRSLAARFFPLARPSLTTPIAFARSTRALATRKSSEHCQPSRSMHLAHRNHTGAARAGLPIFHRAMQTSGAGFAPGSVATFAKVATEVCGRAMAAQTGSRVSLCSHRATTRQRPFRPR